MKPHSYEVGDKVRCISTDNTYRGNQRKITIGDVYTIKQLEGTDKQKLILQEVEDVYATSDTFGYYFHYGDFELAPNDEVTVDADDAWNRAMSIL